LFRQRREVHDAARKVHVFLLANTRGVRTFNDDRALKNKNTNFAGNFLPH
jgi:hypothetical protein